MAPLRQLKSKFFKWICLLIVIASVSACTTTRSVTWRDVETRYDYGDYGTTSTDFYYVGAGYNHWDRGYYGWGS